MPPTTTASALPSDPLFALGPSLFLQVAASLPLSSLLTCNAVSNSWRSFLVSSTSTLFRPLARSIGVEKKHLSALLSLEKAFALPSSWAKNGNNGEETGEEGYDEPIDPSEPAGTIDWKGVVKAFVVLQNNWKEAEARGGWITPGRNTVWRFKVDREEKLIITTSRLDGILISDLETSEPLFEYVDVAAYAHIEFAKGFVVFNIGEDHRLEVHLTPTAYRHLTPARRAGLPPHSRSLTDDTAYSFTMNDHYTPPPPPPIPRSSTAASTSSTGSAAVPSPSRGHLTYYRTIMPPTDCLAFRARIDREDVSAEEGGERPCLATAGAEGAYIFDLEDDSKMERFMYPPEQRAMPNYVEFDDNFLFICGDTQVHIHSRQTTRHLISFPPTGSAPDNDASAIYTVDPKSEFKRVEPPFEGATGVERAEITGKWTGDEGFEEAKRGGRTTRAFTACHYTSSDLMASTKSGCLYVLRDYTSVLSIEDPEKRERALRANLMVITTGEPILQLSTYGEHVIFASGTHVFLLDTSRLPAPPFDVPHSYPSSISPSLASSSSTSSSPSNPAPTRPSLILHTLSDIHPRGLAQSSCFQMDREKVYTTYWALGEVQARGGQGADLPPEEAASDFGLCVKVWDFGLRPGQL